MVMPLVCDYSTAAGSKTETANVGTNNNRIQHQCNALRFRRFRTSCDIRGHRGAHVAPVARIHTNTSTLMLMEQTVWPGTQSGL